MMHLLTLDEMSAADLEILFEDARQLKRARQAGPSHARALAGKTIALLFEKPSLRTRISFEVAARELGGDSLYLSPPEVGLGSREAIADVARVLCAYVHAVVLRTFRHQAVEEFARYASVPVINGLTDAHHPCQGLTDVFTIAEHFGSPAGKTLAYIGDGNNVAHSLIQAAAKSGMVLRIATPPEYAPQATVLAAAQRDAEQTGARIELLHDPVAAAEGAHVLYTDVWTSMGQEVERTSRQATFAPYRIGANLISLAAPEVIVLHPLPAHRGEEVADEVIDGPHSRVFAQAENRLHVQKALLRALMAAETRVSLTA
jgi:ornithine carbamoyltransferase